MSTAAIFMQCSWNIRILHGFLPERLIVLGSAIPIPKAFDGDPNDTYKVSNRKNLFPLSLSSIL